MKYLFSLIILLSSMTTFAQYPMGGMSMGGGMRRPMNSNYGQAPTPRKEVVMSAEERAQNLTDILGKKLDLDSNQFAKTAEINLRYAKKTEEFIMITKAENLPDEIMYKKMKDYKIGSDYRKDNEYKAFLSPEQFEKYIKYRKNNEGSYGYRR